MIRNLLKKNYDVTTKYGTIQLLSARINRLSEK